MGTNPLYSVCIQRAALLVGGYEALAAELELPARVIERWANGLSVAPEAVFLKVVDILLTERPVPPVHTPSPPELSTPL